MKWFGKTCWALRSPQVDQSKTSLDLARPTTTSLSEPGRATASTKTQQRAAQTQDRTQPGKTGAALAQRGAPSEDLPRRPRGTRPSLSETGLIQATFPSTQDEQVSESFSSNRALSNGFAPALAKHFNETEQDIAGELNWKPLGKPMSPF